MASSCGDIPSGSSRFVWGDHRVFHAVGDADTEPFFSPHHTDPSSGYLEDALLEHNDRFKRRRLGPCPDDKDGPMHELAELTSWDGGAGWDLSNMLNCASRTPSAEGFSGDPYTNASAEEAMVAPAAPSSPSYVINSSSSDTSSARRGGRGGERRRKKKVAFPFEVVKGGAEDGEGVSLEDINQRILMPPVRPVRHPVGDFACRPFVSDTRGQGLSGKTVVALTRIHTQGRGTITIIRTKG